MQYARQVSQVEVSALSTEGCRLDPCVMTACESHGGISDSCMIVYDQWYKNRHKSVSFSGHISDGLSMVSVGAEPHKGYVTERVRSSAA